MSEIYYPTKQSNKAENFQSFILNNDYSIQRTRYQIHKAKRLGRIFESEWNDLLSQNLYADLPGRIRIQKMLSEREENHTKQMKYILLNHFTEMKTSLISGFYLSLSFVSFWVIAVILRGVRV